MIIRSVRPETIALIVLSVGLVAYDATRASMMSITHDEAATYIWHVSGRICDILYFTTPGLPDNNHLLLTLLSKLSTWLFGNSEFAIRLPSVLSLALFCTAMAGILRRHLRGPLLVFFFLFTTLNPYLIDMMSIARGYGLGIALATSGLFCLMRAVEPDKVPGALPRALWADMAMVALALAVLAHLSLLLLYVMALVVLLAVFLLNRWRDIHRQEQGATRISTGRLLRVAAGPAAISIVLAPVVLLQVHRLAPRGLLNTEGLTSFFVDTVQNVVVGSLYLVDTVQKAVVDSLDQNRLTQGVVAALCVFACLLPIVGLLLLVLPNRVARMTPRARADLTILLTLLLGASVLSVLQHYLAGVAYLSGRRALLLFPLFSLLCGSIAGACRAGAWPLRWIVLPALMAVVLPLTVSFAGSANFYKTKDWADNADTKNMMMDLAELRAEMPDHLTSLGISWVFEPAINYYRERDHLTEIKPVDRSGPLGRFDAYYVFVEALPSVARANGPMRVLQQYAASGTVLAVPQASPVSLAKSAQ